MSTSIMPNHQEIAFVTPTPSEVERLQAVSDLAYAQMRAGDMLHDQGKAFDYMGRVGRETFRDNPSFALGHQLTDFVLGRTPHQVMVVKLPLDSSTLPPTPNYYPGPDENPVREFDVPRGVLLGALRQSAYGYTSQQPGNIINNVVAIPGQTGVLGVSANAANVLDLHTEDASYNKDGGVLPNGNVLDRAHDASPDLLTLHFLRNNHEIPTTISAPDLSKLSPKAREMLHRPYFLNLTNESQGGSHNDIAVPVSVLYGHDGQPMMRANSGRLVLADNIPPNERAAAEAARQEFLELLYKSAVNLPSSPGDLVLIRNKHVAHGRAEYPKGLSEEDIFGPNSRWQRRVVSAHGQHRKHQKQFEVAHRIIDPQKLHEHIKRL